MSVWSGSVERKLAQTARLLSTGDRLLWIRRAAILLFFIWASHSLVMGLWAILPGAAPVESMGQVINPVSGVSLSESVAVDLEDMVGLGLFGESIAAAEPEPLADTATDSSREGIEDGARESRLGLTLTGIVASTEDGLGSAVIKSGNTELTYAVGDTLPVSSGVTLAKVMSRQVVIDNKGTYELLTLFDDNELSRMASVKSAPGRPVPRAERPVNSQAREIRVDDPARSELAARYRDKFYDEPQTLASVVSVSVVRDDGGLRGYRLAPGREADVFRQLGFRAGDLVTAINGLPLSDPANTLKLYQAMRAADSAYFEVERGGVPVSISVSLNAEQ
ncbi:type II secretion system protein GspC [Luminiphilus syltensis]|uniref:type II secretion system protein GspC n=1 Tax=Luminiphilus syltensis TaxID=1341119 RepID=UPI001E4D83A0|nr:type II secretion system protein GspC [Luminiphilus syltensis]